MFSMPLAYPSTLDRRPLACACAPWSPSYVEELWSPSLMAALGKPQAKANANCQRVFPPRNAEGLSLSGGASI
jgi:hypothetical protein